MNLIFAHVSMALQEKLESLKRYAVNMAETNAMTVIRIFELTMTILPPVVFLIYVSANSVAPFLMDNATSTTIINVQAVIMAID